MGLDDSALVEQCIKGRIQVCNRSLNERDVYVFPICWLYWFLSYSDEKNNVLNQ